MRESIPIAQGQLCFKAAVKTALASQLTVVVGDRMKGLIRIRQVVSDDGREVAGVTQSVA